MKTVYDKYYQTENLFGNAFPALIRFFSQRGRKGKVLDLGCGQGRDAIPLARLGYTVTAVDKSKVGIEQLNEIAEKEGLKLTTSLSDIFLFDNFEAFDFILLDSMFHFTKKDLKKETSFIQRIIAKGKKDTTIIFCVQDTGYKVDILYKTINAEKRCQRILDQKMKYFFEDKASGHQSTTDYRMIVVKL